MAYTTIKPLKEKDGSSKRAIAKYIEQVYKDQLTQSHESLLTHHLKHLKSNRMLVMDKKSYKLPGSVPPLPPSESIAAPSPASRPRGRPNKVQPQPLPEVQPQRNSSQRHNPKTFPLSSTTRGRMLSLFGPHLGLLIMSSDLNLEMSSNCVNDGVIGEAYQNLQRARTVSSVVASPCSCSPPSSSSSYSSIPPSPNPKETQQKISDLI